MRVATAFAKGRKRGKRVLYYSSFGGAIQGSACILRIELKSLSIWLERR